MGNRIFKQSKKQPDKSELDLRCQQIMSQKVAESMSKTAVELKMQVSGQAAIESKAGDQKLMVIFACYPTGDVMMWFVDRGYFCLMALVNKKNYITTFPATHAEAFQEELTKLQKSIEG